MTIRISAAHNEARLAATLAQLDEGLGNAVIEFYGTARPVEIYEAPSSPVLARIDLTKPAGSISSGVLTLTAAADGLVFETGEALWARFLNGNALVVMDGDCSGPDGSGDVKLDAAQLYAGGSARLVSAAIG